MKVDLLVIAGEHSGDNHAALFVRQLKAKHPQLSIYAVGGPALEEAGARLIFNILHLSVVGLVETLKHYGEFTRLMDYLVEWIRIYQPSIVCLVDFPGFNLRLAERLWKEKLSKKSGGSTCVCEYIAPQVWAWKENRKFKMERFIDHLGVIFPFEKEYFSDTLLDVQFVGHPLLQQKNPFYYDENGPLLLLPGSRIEAVKRIFPLLVKAFEDLKSLHPELEAILPYPNQEIKAYLESTKLTKGISLYPLKRVNKGVRAAIMSSGTASLQVALAGIPGVVTYKANPLTFFIGKHFVKIPYLSIANLLLKQTLYSECLQNLPHQASVITLHMEVILSNQAESRKKFHEGAQQIVKLLTNHQMITATNWLERYFD